MKTRRVATANEARATAQEATEEEQLKAMAIPATRQLTICNKAFARESGRYVYFPTINLTGKWLQQHGFKSGQVVDIACEEGKLVITVAKQQRFSNI